MRSASPAACDLRSASAADGRRLQSDHAQVLVAAAELEPDLADPGADVEERGAGRRQPLGQARESGNTNRASGSTARADITPWVSRICSVVCDQPASSRPPATRAASSPACSSALRASARTNRSRAPELGGQLRSLHRSPSRDTSPSASSTSRRRSASSSESPARRASSGPVAGSESAAARPVSSAAQSAPSAQADSDSSPTTSPSSRSSPASLAVEQRPRGLPPSRTA